MWYSSSGPPGRKGPLLVCLLACLLASACLRFKSRLQLRQTLETELVKRVNGTVIDRDSHEPTMCNPNWRRKKKKKGSCFAKAKNEVTGFQKCHQCLYVDFVRKSSLRFLKLVVHYGHGLHVSTHTVNVWGCTEFIYTHIHKKGEEKQTPVLTGFFCLFC